MSSTPRPWSWQPDPAGYFARVSAAADRWRPDPSVVLDRRVIVDRVHRAAADREEWVWHPCLDRLTGAETASTARDIQLAVWVGDHSDEPLGGLRLEEPVDVWTSAGVCGLAAGRHTLGPYLAVAHEASRRDAERVYPDLWCDSVGTSITDSWASSPPETDQEWGQVRDGVRRLMTAREILRERVPEVWGWLSPVVPIVVPLRPSPGRFRSGSDPGAPGLVRVDCESVTQILEGLVHEAAHEYLFRCEVPEPLADPADEQRYHSPLRPEPRPLRGILMAYHALAYICALFAELVQREVLEGEHVRSELLSMRAEASAAGATLHEHRDKLSAGGVDFVERTDRVLAYSAA